MSVNQRPSEQQEGRLMEQLKVFQSAARKAGFVPVNKRVQGTVLWFRKSAPEEDSKIHQRMCIDRLTNSVTIYWITLEGEIDSKTFRGTLALREWINRTPRVTPR
jgi:hypothetical protein